MSASTSRAARRNIRRTVGAEAADIVNEHEIALAHHADVLKSLKLTAERLERRIGEHAHDQAVWNSQRMADIDLLRELHGAQLDALHNQCPARRMTLWERVKWVLHG